MGIHRPSHCWSILDELPDHTDFIDDRKSLLGWKCAELALSAAQWSRKSFSNDKMVVFVGTVSLRLRHMK